ncbi:hypothetical protein BVC93_07430 [Mycobacterium sp. MS1601]|uniref:hypothetical protein n=1 Tax=Mycobacterium sp. MS1601 TaxID=1936029 RepID=UPI0009796169|nr:hypothetical protein [Mycobacterium sp. MS1601]AQA02291.1 hypothetical protein BVC93_07430 [Mycobacterium sp. MS1601]
MVKVLMAAMVSAAIGISAAAAAHADPVPPPPPPPASPLFPLQQNGPSVPITGPDVLGQHAVPSAPGTAATVAPNLNPWNNQYLLSQNQTPAAPGDGVIVGVAPGQENADVSRLDYLKRLIDTYRDGGLEGGLLGQNPVEGVGKPLPVEPSLP